MTSFLSALGGRLAERWLQLLVLPGLLFLGTAAAARLLGHAHWADLGKLSDWVRKAAEQPSAGGSGTLLLGSAAVVLAAAGTGFAAQAVGGFLERQWLGGARDPLSRFLTRRRAERWQARYEAVTREYGAGRHSGPEAARHEAVLDRIAQFPPVRPTWSGDRIAAVHQRVSDAYGLDLKVAWPCLWLVLPEQAQTAVQSARSAFSDAARLAAWGVGYALLAVWWWPGLMIAAGTWATAWRQGRAAVDSFAVLVEAAVDLHGRDLARSLGHECPGPLDIATGRKISWILRKKPGEEAP